MTGHYKKVAEVRQERQNKMRVQQQKHRPVIKLLQKNKNREINKDTAYDEINAKHLLL